MADREQYIPSRGRSLLGVSGVSAGNGLAQNLNTVAGLFAGVAEAQQDYNRTLHVQTLNDAIASSTLTFREIEARNYAAPEAADREISAHIEAKSGELGKINPEIAARYRINTQLTRREVHIRTSDDASTESGRTARGRWDPLVESTNADIAQWGAESAGQQAKVADAMMRMHGELKSKKLDEMPVYSPEEQAQNALRAADAWAMTAMQYSIRHSDDPESLAKSIESGEFTMPWPDEDGLNVSPRTLQEIAPDRVSQMAAYARSAAADRGHEEVLFDAQAYSYAQGRIEAFEAGVGEHGSGFTGQQPPAEDYLLVNSGNPKTATDDMRRAGRIMLDADARDRVYYSPQSEHARIIGGMPDTDKDAGRTGRDSQESDIANNLAGFAIGAAPKFGLVHGERSYQEMMASIATSAPNPGAVAAWEEVSETLYEHFEVPQQDWKVFTPGDAAILADTILHPPVKEGESLSGGIHRNLLGLQAHFGPKTPAVIHELYNQGLEGGYVVVMNSRPGPVVSDLLSAMEPENAKAIEDLYPRNGATDTDILDSVNTAMAGFVKTIPPDDIRLAKDYTDSVVLLTKEYMRRGVSRSAAIARAHEGLIDQTWEISSDVRVPKEEYTDQIGAWLTPLGLREILTGTDWGFDTTGATDPNQTDPESIRAEYLKAVARTGRFMTNYNETGVVIVDSEGTGTTLKVRAKDGRLVDFTLTWNELDKLVGHTQEEGRQVAIRWSGGPR